MKTASVNRSGYSGIYSVDRSIATRLGRRLRIGVVGGGAAAQIAETHRLAMRFDDAFEIVSGVLSSDPERSIRDGKALGIARSYPNLEKMLLSEGGRSDRPDIIAIMTPNDLHSTGCIESLRAGYHVICDKPLANSSEDASAVAILARQQDRLICVTQNYSGYPMIRQMRAMVCNGTIGTIHQVQVRYAQGNLGQNTPMEQMPKALRWRLDPSRGGQHNLLLDVGTHAHHLLWFTTGMDFVSLQADVGASFPNRPYDDTAMVFGRLSNGARASLIATKAATGAPNILDIEIYGCKGGLSWRQQDPQKLIHWSPDAPSQHYHRGVTALDQQTIFSMRNPRPHPEGFREAFANIYSDFGQSVVSCLLMEGATTKEQLWADADYAVKSLLFVEACIKSSSKCCVIHCNQQKQDL